MPTEASSPSTPSTGAATPRAPACSSPVVTTYAGGPALAAEQDRLARQRPVVSGCRAPTR